MNAADLDVVRVALADLPDGTSYGDMPAVENVYLPRSHLKAMDPNRLVITGMRGAGKTFWWSALQNPSVRQLVGKAARGHAALNERTEVRRGFGVKPATDDYPGRDELRSLMSSGADPRMIWRTVQAWQGFRRRSSAPAGGCLGGPRSVRQRQSGAYRSPVQGT